MLDVKIHKKALKELDSLPPDVRTRILDICRSMRDDPFEGDVKPLRGSPAYSGGAWETTGSPSA